MLSIPTLYKHTEKRWVRAARDEGSIRVGTLAYYRSVGGHRQDALEGQRIVEFAPREQIRLSKLELRRVTPPNITIRSVGPGSTFVEFAAGARGVFSGTAENDVYILFGIEVADAEGFGDGVYAINDPYAFGRGVLDALREMSVPVDRFVLGNVVYDDSRQIRIERTADVRGIPDDHYRITQADYFLKPLGFHVDLEWRYVFVLRSPAIKEYLNVRCDPQRLAGCCEFPSNV